MRELRFLFLGGFEVFGGESPLQGFISDKSRALLGYLVAQAGHDHRREHLAGLFWPEKPESCASHSLSQAVYSLHKSIQCQVGWNPLLITPQAVQYQWDNRSWLDVLEFDGLLQRCECHAHESILACQLCRSHLEQAFRLYRGEYHQGLCLFGCEAYQEWLAEKRALYHQKMKRVTRWLAEGLWFSGSPEQALYYAQRLTSLNPFGEETHQLYLRLCLALGMRNEAMLHYKNFRQLLISELGVEPDDDTRHIYEQISTLPEAVPTSREASAKPPFESWPPIGRRKEWV